jgi:hypothetical protein
LTGLGLFTKGVEAAGLLAALNLKGVLSWRTKVITARFPSLIALIALFSALAALAVSDGQTAHAHGDDRTTEITAKELKLRNGMRRL